MSKLKKPAAGPRWRISRIKSTPAVDLGTVQAPDEASAIRKAIEEFQITDPHQQQLILRRHQAG